MKVSKYDLDRANIDMQAALKEKEKRRNENAAVRRSQMGDTKKKEAVSAAKAKVAKIRDLSVMKQKEKQQRRENALLH